MSNLTAKAAARFVTAYGSATKSSVAMVNACVDILNDGTPATALVASVRGAYESKNGAFPTAKDAKAFETLVSQRSFAAQLVLIVGEDAATDELAIKAALRVASGALPRKAALAIASTLKGSNDAPSFAAAITEALAAKKAAPRTPAGTSAPRASEAPAPAVTAPEALGFKDILRALDEAIRTETDAKRRDAMRKALQIRTVRLSQPATPVAA